MKIKSFIFLFLFSISICDGQKSNHKSIIQIIFTSDAHSGIKRNAFRNSNGVEGHIVNAAMVKEMNSLSEVKLPVDGGINTDKIAGPVYFVIEGGDVANRMEVPLQSAVESWKQFSTLVGVPFLSQAHINHSCEPPSGL